jgi:hypothetical protein
VSFDNSRYTFDPLKNYSGVIMEQGRVQLDSDWNEWVAELSRRLQAGTLDLMGHASYPPTTPSAFLINAASGSPNTVSIGCGRMYVDGLLAENHGDPTKAAWDPALADLSGTPQPIDPSNPNPYPISFVNQPYLPGAIAPTDSGTYLAYLDVWTRAVDYLEDANLVDKAVGVDTTGRLQTVWQVKLMSLANVSGTITCSTSDSEIPYPPHSAGQLTTDVAPNPSAGPCCLTDGTGYTGVENQFYRVEIHNTGQASNAGSGATFKWSRDNASVETGVTAISSALNSVGATASQLTVQSLGRDQVLGFKNGDWIELLDDWSELWGNPGVMCQIDSVSFPNKTITLTAPVNTTAAAPGPGVPATFPVGTGNLTDSTRHTRIRRWDQSGKIYDINGNQWCDLSTTGGVIPVPASKTLVLENGITVTFGLNPTTGQFNVADFWTFAARTADGSVEKLNAAPPRGIHHHYTKLSIVTFSSPASYTDCRTPWTTGGSDDCGCCTVTVGDNVTSFGKYSSIQQAINSLPTTGPNPGGEICILPGRYFEYITLNGLADVVIHGCGSHTRLASPTFQPIQIEIAKPKSVSETKASKPATKASFKARDTSDSSNTPESGLQAIITVIGCTNIEIRDLAIEAADTEAGILLDGTSVFDPYQYIDIGLFSKFPGNYAPGKEFTSEFPSNITITDLAITASTLPAIVAVDTRLLKIRNNRIAMKDVPGQWAGIYASGSEIHIDGNWIGLQDSSSATTWMPSIIQTDVPDGFSSANSPATPVGNGGIHIAGPSRSVLVSNNQIEGGSRNGITLGSFALVNANNANSGILTGLLATQPDPASTTFTLQLPTSIVANDQDQRIVAGGLLQNIQIVNNQIRNSGLCGIGPVGFFNLVESLEIITIQNLTIVGNTITGTLLDPLQGVESGTATLLGYGAICVPDVQNLIVRDNTITDFGILPGTYVCGIFVFNGEQVEISRNQVIETRDWSTIPNLANVPSGGVRAGISILFVTPLALDQLDTASAWAAASTTNATGAQSGNTPLYQPGLLALRMEENVVRIPLGLALEVLGVGPFAVSGNHFSSGGTIPASVINPTTGISQTTGFSTARSFTPFLTVLMMNLGKAIEIDTPGTSFASLFANGAQPTLNVADNALSDSSSGQILFTNNQCQLETRASGAEGTSSVAILTADNLIFSNNHLWIDGPPTAIMDALLVAGSIQATANRLQEGAGTVYVSGLTYGLSNITTMNTSTYCLFAVGAPALSIVTHNIVLNSTLCAELAKKV